MVILGTPMVPFLLWGSYGPRLSLLGCTVGALGPLPRTVSPAPWDIWVGWGGLPLGLHLSAFEGLIGSEPAPPWGRPWWEACALGQGWDRCSRSEKCSLSLVC